MKRRIPIARRTFLARTAFAAAIAGASAGVAQNRKPNVVIVLVDDVGYGDLAILGNPVVSTPNLDRFAAESVRFSDFHVDPTGGPTRAALLTGQYSARLGVWSGSGAVRRLPPGEHTLATAFAEAGYRTGFVGAWRLSMQPFSRPRDHGFHFAFTRMGGTLRALGLPWDTDGLDDTYLRDGVPEVGRGAATELWFSEAAGFIERNKDAPHFLLVALSAPWEGPAPQPAEVEKYASGEVPPETANHLARVSRFDAALGGFLGHLVASGTDENTLVLFLSGNGTSNGVRLYAPEGMLAEDGIPEAGFNDGMRGKKGSVFDGGHRIPCFLRLNGPHRAAARDNGTLAAHIDLAPTLLGICDIKKPRNLKPDGIDLTKILLEDAQGDPDRTVFIVNQGGLKAEKFDAFAVISDRWCLVGNELFDREAEQGQMSDIAAFQPRVAERIRESYSIWYDAVARNVPPFVKTVVGAEGEAPVHLTADDWVGDLLPGGRMDVAAGRQANGYWPLRVARDGTYSFTLRRWPEDLDLPLNAAIPGDSQSRPIPIVGAALRVGETEAVAETAAQDRYARFDLKLGTGEIQIEATFRTESGENWGAYYVRIERTGD